MFWYGQASIRAGFIGGSSGSMEPLDFSEGSNGTTRFLNLDAMEPVNFLSLLLLEPLDLNSLHLP